MKKVQWLLENINEDLNSTSRNTIAYRKTMHIYHFISLLLTALITVSVGISYIPYGKEIALGLGAVASIIIGIQSSERFYDRIYNWSTFDHELTHIKQKLEFYIAGKQPETISEDDELVCSLHEEYLRSKKKFNEKWSSHFTKSSKQTP